MTEIDWVGLTGFMLCGVCPALLMLAVVIEAIGTAARQARNLKSKPDAPTGEAPSGPTEEP